MTSLDPIISVFIALFKSQHASKFKLDFILHTVLNFDCLEVSQFRLSIGNSTFLVVTTNDFGPN